MRCGFIITIGFLFVASTAVAQDEDSGPGSCEDPTVRAPDTAFPAVSATQVSLDAPVRIRYSPGYFEPGGPGGDPAVLISVSRCPSSAVCVPSRCDETGEFVPGRAQVLGPELVFLPDAPWQPNTAYAGIARGVDGDLPFHFCTGSTNDLSPPDLGRITEVTSTPSPPRCGSLEGGFRIAVFFPPAVDLGPPGSIEYLLFQTRGPGIDSPIMRDSLRNFPTESVPMAFVLPPAEAVSPICVRVAAIDGVGNADLSDAAMSGETCVDPVQGNFFYPLCHAAPHRPGPAPVGWLLAGLGLFAWRARRLR